MQLLYIYNIADFIFLLCYQHNADFDGKDIFKLLLMILPID